MDKYFNVFNNSYKKYIVPTFFCMKLKHERTAQPSVTKQGCIAHISEVIIAFISAI